MAKTAKNQVKVKGSQINYKVTWSYNVPFNLWDHKTLLAFVSSGKGIKYVISQWLNKEVQRQDAKVIGDRKVTDSIYHNFKITRNKDAENYNSPEQVLLREQALNCIKMMNLLDSVQIEWRFTEADCLNMLGIVQQIEAAKDEAKENDLPGSDDDESDDELDDESDEVIEEKKGKGKK